uniref:Uncharacterized protein n=1 Tax=Glossina pallidipes TaxID=7398 RepID=A0A1A9ZQ74_GLOPL
MSYYATSHRMTKELNDMHIHVHHPKISIKCFCDQNEVLIHCCCGYEPPLLHLNLKLENDKQQTAYSALDFPAGSSLNVIQIRYRIVRGEENSLQSFLAHKGGHNRSIITIFSLTNQVIWLKLLRIMLRYIVMHLKAKFGVRIGAQVFLSFTINIHMAYKCAMPAFVIAPFVIAVVIATRNEELIN